jgi:hypothetical protein
MKYLIPNYINNVIPDRVIDSIKRQTVKCEIIAIGGMYNRKDRAGELQSRNLCFDYGCSVSDVFVVGDDSSEHLYEDNVELMLEKLDEGYDVIALRKQTTSYNEHINMACMMFRSSLVKDIRLRIQGGIACFCEQFRESIIESGGRIKYLDGVERVSK